MVKYVNIIDDVKDEEQEVSQGKGRGIISVLIYMEQHTFLIRLFRPERT